MEKQKNTFDTEENIIQFFITKYLPFWPLFLILIVIGVASSFAFLYFYTPVYESSASLIIKDQQKGVDASKMAQSMNFFNSKKIVENEIKVLQSRNLVKQVVNELSLYAPIFEYGILMSKSAYNSSPIRIKMKNPEELFNLKKTTDDVYFLFDSLQNNVLINNTTYPLNKWVETPYGILQFFKNKNKITEPQNELYFTLSNSKVVINSILDDLNVMSSDKLSTVVNITLKDPVPSRGVDILNHLMTAYNNASKQEVNTLASNTLSFIDNRLKNVVASLDSIEAEVQQYRTSEGVVDLSEQGRIYLRNVSVNDSKVSDIKLQLAILNKIENYVVSKDNKTGIVPSTLGVSDALLSSLLQKLYNSEIEYEKLKRTVAENNPTLIGIKNEIEKIRPSILENVQSQRANLKASLNNLSGTNQDYNSVLQTIPQKERKLLEINRKKAVVNELYSYLLQKREEIALSYSPSAQEAKIVDLAESTVKPVFPKPIIVFPIGIIVALALGICFIYVKEGFNPKILFRAEIEKMVNEPVVSEIWSIQKLGNKPISADAGNRFLIDQFRDLNVATGVFKKDSSIKKILVTSSIKGDGKSFISKNVAMNIALSGRKVVLLDFDLRSRNLSKMFDFSEEAGITDCLTKSIKVEKAIQSTECENLYVLPAGKELENAPNLLVNNKLSELFSYLESSFDYIVLDTPPIELFSDAYLLSEYCDSTLFVIRHAHTPKNIIKRFDQNVRNQLFNNLSIIFNGVKSRGTSKSLYDYGYGYAHNVPNK